MSEPASIQYPRPAWKPSVVQPLDRLAARFKPFVKLGRDFVVFKHGTCAVVEPQLPEAVAHERARVILDRTVNQPPDMRPTELPGGDVLILYNQPAATVVLDDIARAHWLHIENRHKSALLPDEVLIMPAGPNVFDSFAKKVLFGRCFLYMDAEAMEVDRLVRAHS